MMLRVVCAGTRPRHDETRLDRPLTVARFLPTSRCPRACEYRLVLYSKLILRVFSPRGYFLCFLITIFCQSYPSDTWSIYSRPFRNACLFPLILNDTQRTEYVRIQCLPTKPTCQSSRQTNSRPSPAVSSEYLPEPSRTDWPPRNRASVVPIEHCELESPVPSGVV